jgi:hypothetical protein
MNSIRALMQHMGGAAEARSLDGQMTVQLKSVAP